MPDALSRRAFLKGVGALSLSGSLAAGMLKGGEAPGAPRASAPAPATDAPIVDSHVHVWKKDPLYPWAPETKNPPDKDATAEMLLELMKAAGVRRTVIIQVIHYRWDNRYAASVLKKYPQYFRGVARVNPQDPAAPDHLSRLTTEDGFHGVRLSPGAGPADDWIRGPLMPPLWQRCRELKVPMTLLIPITRAPDVGLLLERFPDLTVVIDHMGDSPLNQPKQLEKLIELRRYPKLFVKVSHSWSLSAQPYPYLDAQEQIHRLYDAFGPKRLMAGTDWPLSEKLCTYTQAVDVLRTQTPFLNAEDKRWICGLTSGLVWPFGVADERRA